MHCAVHCAGRRPRLPPRWLLFLLAVPALWDLRRLLVGLGVTALGLALAIVAFSYFDTPTQPIRRTTGAGPSAGSGVLGEGRDLRQ